MLCESFPHGKFIGRYIDTIVRIMWQSKLLCQILHGNIGKVRCYCCNCIRLNLPAFF